MPGLSRIRFLLSAGALLVFFFHFLLTLAYISPYDWELGKVRSAARLYVGPFFHQNWKVFAPEPPLTEQRFEYRVQFVNGQWSDWTDPGTTILAKHHANRFAHYGKEFNIYESMAHNLRTIYERFDYYLDQNMPNRQQELDSSMVRVGAYRMATRYAIEKGEEAFDRDFVQVQFRSRYDSIPPPGGHEAVGVYLLEYLPAAVQSDSP